jgi:hypothetical protein
LSGRRGIDTEIARLSHRRLEDLLFALRVDNGCIAGVLPRGHVAHEMQASLHQLKYGAYVRIRVGKCRSGARRRR